MTTVQPLPPEQLFHYCDPEQFPFETTAELDGPVRVIGQERAVQAIRFGVGIEQQGFNLFALGPHGLGKHTAVTQYIEQVAAEKPTPDDWCYVHNFEQAHQPNALRLPAGKGKELVADMQRLLDEVRAAIPAAFESEDYHNQRQVIEEEFKKQQEQAFEELQAKAREKKIALIQTPGGLAFAPMENGEVIGPKEFLNLSEEQQKEVQAEVESLQADLQRILRQVPQWRKENRKRLKELNTNVAAFALAPLFEELLEKYSGVAEVPEYLQAVRAYTVEHVERFLPAPDQDSPLALMMGGIGSSSSSETFAQYEVNLIVDNSETVGAPVIYCDLPTYQNLLGRVEHTQQMGALITNFTLIKPGALHRANGGYLLLDARKLLQQPYAWEGLKRALQGREIVIESLGQVYSLISTISLEPEAIPLDVKVVLMGDRLLYYLLYQYDPEFGELFKVMADFDDHTDRTPEAIHDYARMLATLARNESLRHFTKAAVARVIEYATRQAGDKEKLSAHMQSISDLAREANYWAAQHGHDVVDRSDVQRAIEAQRYRASRLEEAMRETILKNTIFIDTSGERVGQINGLSVLFVGNYAFGKPSRITATIRMGKGDVVDIERQVDMSGPIHSKGVLILSSFLSSRYAVNRPLSLSASLVFEQSYAGVDGDSASSTELYALLSALSGAPIRQNLAVTGSVNQFGEVQAIGGVNEKIEGFFDICKARGLTGDQGVLIPAANIRHLMLRRDVIEAVEAGQFHIYPVETIDQGIELLTGIPAGEPDEEGNYPEGTINGMVVARLEEINEKQRQLSKTDRDEDEEENPEPATKEQEAPEDPGPEI